MASSFGVTTAEFQCLRSVMFLVVGVLCCCYRGESVWISNHKIYLIFLRTILGTANFMLSIWVLTMVPLSIVIILTNLAPFWTSVLGYYINKEPIIKYEYLAMAICFTCVVAITLSKDTSVVNLFQSTMVVGMIFTVIRSWT